MIGRKITDQTITCKVIKPIHNNNNNNNNNINNNNFNNLITNKQS